MDNDKRISKETETKNEVLSINELEYNIIDAQALEAAVQRDNESSDSSIEYEEDTDEMVEWDEEAPDDQADVEGGIDEMVAEMPMKREVIGRDDTRKQVRQVGNIKKAPFRWICSLKSSFRDPDNPRKIVEFDSGTGLLISPNHVLTAAHVVYAEITGSRGTKQKQKAIRTKVYAGRDGKDSSAIASAISHSYAYPNAFTKELDVRWDYALIKLNRKMGLQKCRSLNNQVLGYWGSPNWGQKTLIKALSTNYLKTQILNVGGYPKNKNGLQYLAFDKVKEVPPTAKGKPIPELITYLVDTGDGQSGAPVWKYIKSSGKRYLVAIHHGECIPGLDGCMKSGKVSSNLGVLITNSVLKQILSWKKTM